MNTYAVILISGHSRKFRFGEDKRFEVLCLGNILILGIDVDDMEAWLVSVHGVKDYLQKYIVNANWMIKEGMREAVVHW